jgi:hypothetical protein
MRIDYRFLSIESLCEALIMSPTVLHISGHGTLSRSGTYSLALESMTGAADMLEMDRLATLLRSLSGQHNGLGPELRIRVPVLVFLGVCYSQHAAALFIEVRVMLLMRIMLPFLTQYDVCRLVPSMSSHAAQANVSWTPRRASLQSIFISRCSVALL